MDYCDLHKRADCTLCDECGHDAAAHLNAHDLTGDVARLVFDSATCWAENVCETCDPLLYARVWADLIAVPVHA
jgi:hypothetical protein